MADYSYAGLNVVVRAITGPMQAEIRAAALKSGDEAALSLEKAMNKGLTSAAIHSAAMLERGITDGMKAGWRNATRITEDGLKTIYPVAAKQGARFGAAFSGALLGAVKTGARKAGEAASLAFDATLTPKMAQIGTAAAVAMESPFTLGVRKAAANAAISASVAFDLTLAPKLEKIGAAAGAVWGTPFGRGVQRAAASAAVTASLVFEAQLKPGLARAAERAGEALGALSLAARKAAANAAISASVLFDTEFAPRMAAAARAASTVFGRVLKPAITKVASVTAAAVSDVMDGGMRAAGRRAGEQFSAAMRKTVVPGVTSVAKGAGKALAAVGETAGLLGAGFVGYAVKAGVQYNILYQKSQKAFTTILGSQKAADKMMTNLAKFAKTSPFPRQTFIAATQQMLGFGVQAKNIIPTLSAVQDAVAAVGGNAKDISGVVAVLAKVQSMGKFTARTLNEMGNRGIDAAALIGKGMNMTSGQVRIAITKNKLDTQAAMTALVTQMQIKYKGAATGLKSTWIGAKQSIQAAMRDIGSAIVEPFISKKGGGLAIQWANKLGKVLWKLEPAVQPLADAMMKSLAPAINAVNIAINWLLDQANKLSGKNLKTATAAVQKFGAAGLAASLGLGALAGGKLVSGLPIIGDILKGLLAPLTALTDLGAAVAIPFVAIAAAIALVVISSKKLQGALTGFGKAAVAAAMPAVHEVIAGFKTLWPLIWNVAKTIGDALAPVIQHLTPLLAPLGTILAGVLHIWFKAMERIMIIAVLDIKLFGKIVGTVLIWIIDYPLTWLVKALVWVVKWVVFFSDHTRQVLDALFNILMGIWRPVQAETVRIWKAITGALAKAFNWVKKAVSDAWHSVASTTATVWDSIISKITGFGAAIKGGITDTLKWIKDQFTGAWDGLVSGAKAVGGNVLRTLKNGFETAWKDISSWVSSHIVGPIVNAVKWFFHIGGHSPSAGASAGKAGTAAMGFGAQGGGGTSVSVASAAGGDGGDSGGGLWGNIGGIFTGMVENIVTTSPMQIAEHIFGSAADALGWMVVKGTIAVESLGKFALGALEKIPGVRSALGFIGGALGGGVAGVTGLVDRALAYAGHPYIWGGGANAATGFDCSSFVNMIAGMAGLPLPGGFHAPSREHGPVTTNWLSYGGMSTIPYDSMLPGDLYVNASHMGIVTGKGMGFAARSTESRTGPQAVPRGVYTIRRFPAGGGLGGGVGNGDILAQALSGILSQRQGLVPVVAGSSSQNLETIARYMFGHGWSLPGAAGVAGNVYRESLGDPLSYGSGGRGLIGWTPPNTLPNSAFIAGNPSASLSAQLPLVNSFFRGNMGRYWSLANAQSDAGMAALVIMNMGERPAGSSQSNPFFGGTGTSAGSQRASMARNIFELLRQSATVKMAGGGVIREPVAGLGASGTRYLLGEAGPEGVLPAKLLEYLKRVLAMAARTATAPMAVGGPAGTAVGKTAAAATVAVSKAAVATAAAAAAGKTTTAAAEKAAKQALKDAQRAAKVAATNAARTQRVSATNAAAFARTEAANTARLAKVTAANAARLVKAQASITARMSKVDTGNATRLARARETNLSDAQKAATTNAAALARAEARHYASAQTRANALARVNASNAERLHKLAISNATRLARANTTNAAKLAAAEATSDAQLTKTKATNAAALAKANATNAEALAKAQATALEALEKAGYTAAEALKKLAAENVAVIAAATGRPPPPTTARITIQAHPRASLGSLGNGNLWPGMRVGGPGYTPKPAAGSTVHAVVTGRGGSAVLTAQQEQQLAGASRFAGVTVNVYPRANQSETEIAAAVSRSANWAAQGGAR